MTVAMKKIQLKCMALEELMNEINRKVKDLTEEAILVFKPITITIRYSSAELCFNTFIQWGYSIFFEASGISLDLLIKRVFTNADLTAILGTKEFVQSQRTVQSHTLDLTKSRDVNILNESISWFKRVIDKQEPETDDEWYLCVGQLVGEVENLLRSINNFLDYLFTYEQRDTFIEEWKFKYNRIFPKYKYAEILNIALKNYNLEAFVDNEMFLARHYNSWVKKISVQADGFIFEECCYSIIEQSIINEDLCPINGKDLIELGYQQSIALKDILNRAKELFKTKLCSKEVLLAQIIKEFPLD